MAYRRHLWSLGFRVAEAMELPARHGIRLAEREGTHPPLGVGKLARRRVPISASGVGTDQLDPADAGTLDDVIAAYEEQFEFVEGVGGRVIMMASRALAKVARGPRQLCPRLRRPPVPGGEPVILHWLGEMFDPALAGYWGTRDFEPALDTVVDLIERHRGKIEGIKISLLDAGKEIALRGRLPEGVMMFTGDDFNYADLIAGDGSRHSHALLGIFDAIAPAASRALALLAEGDLDGYNAVLAPTVALSRRIFEAPTEYYKAGIVFIAWLNGHQDHFVMVGGMQSARGILHYADVFRLADRSGVLRDPALAVGRMKSLCELHGIHD